LIVDFHSHTFESDGSLSPADLIAAMRKRGVTIFSITDHDTIQAYASIGEVDGAKIIPGIEINTTWQGNEVHILGYGLPLDESPLTATLEKNRGERRARVERMVAGLTKAGYPITYEDVLAETKGGVSLGRPHVAKALMRKKYIKDVESAFRSLLARGGPGYQPSLYITPYEAIDVIARSGGVPVLAHPGRLKDDAIIDDLAMRGLQGIEVFYGTHTPSQVSRYRGIAARHGLVMTAGSDFHDIRYNAKGVGMDVDEDDLRPFLELVA